MQVSTSTNRSSESDNNPLWSGNLGCSTISNFFSRIQQHPWIMPTHPWGYGDQYMCRWNPNRGSGLQSVKICYSFRLATNSLLISSVTTLLLPRSCGGIRAFPAALLTTWGCGCVLGNLLRESWSADPFDSLFLDAFSVGGAKRSATSGRSNDGVGRETLLELMGAMFLEQKDKIKKLRNCQYHIKPRKHGREDW